MESVAGTVRCVRPSTALAALLCGLVAPASPTSARDDNEVEEGGGLGRFEEDAQAAAASPELVQIRFRPYSEFIANSDFGEFESNTYTPGARLKVTTPVARRAAVRFLVNGNAALYDFSDVDTELGGVPTTSDPFGDLYATTFRLQGGYRLANPPVLFSEDERWSLLAEGFAKARWEEGADFGSGVNGGGAVAVGYQIADWLEVVGGFAVETKMLSNKIRIRPVGEFRWRIDEHWTLRSRGRGGIVEYAPNGRLTLFLEGGLRSTSYRLASRPGIGKGRLRDRRIPVLLGVRWKATRQLRVTLSAGSVIHHKLEIQDNERQKVGDVTAGPAPVFEIRFDLRP